MGWDQRTSRNIFVVHFARVDVCGTAGPESNLLSPVTDPGPVCVPTGVAVGRILNAGASACSACMLGTYSSLTGPYSRSIFLRLNFNVEKKLKCEKQAYRQTRKPLHEWHINSCKLIVSEYIAAQRRHGNQIFRDTEIPYPHRNPIPAPSKFSPSPPPQNFD
jgi:hypothetical protein